MALEAFLDSNSQSPMPIILPLNGSGGIFEALNCHSSLKNEEDLQSILSMAQLNTNFDSDFTNSTILGNSSTSRSALDHDAAIAFPPGAHLQSLGNTTMEPYNSLPSYAMPFPSGNPGNVFYSDDTISHLCEAREKENKRQHWENAIGPTDIYKTKVQPRQDSLPGRTKQETDTIGSSLKRSRIDVNQENIQQDVIQKLLLKELQDCNPQLKEMIEQYRQQAQLRGLHLQIPNHLVKTQSRSPVLDQGNRQEILAPLLDGGICSRRFKQYLFHLFLGAQNRATFNEQPCPRFHANGCWMFENGVFSGPGNLGLTFVNPNDHMLGTNSSVASSRRNGGAESCITGPPNQAVASGQSFSSFLHNEATRQYDQTCGTSKEVRYGESSNGANIFLKAGDLSSVSTKITVKEEPYSPERLSEASLSSGAGFPKIQNFSW